MNNGVLSSLNLAITSQFEAASITFTTSNLDFYYNNAASQYEIDSGSLAFKTSEGFTFRRISDFRIPPIPAKRSRVW